MVSGWPAQRVDTMYARALAVAFGIGAAGSAAAGTPPTPYSEHFGGYTLFPGAAVVDVAIGPPVGPGGTLSAFAIVQVTTGPSAGGWHVQVARTAPGLASEPPAFQGTPFATNEPGRLSLCTADGGVPANEAIRFIPPFPVFDVIVDDGTQVIPFPPMNLDFMSLYNAVACASTPQELRLFAQHDATGNVQAFRVRPPEAQLEDSGLFWFFDTSNIEMLVKVLEATPITNRYWVFAAATTDISIDVKQVDMKVARYTSPTSSPMAPATAVSAGDPGVDLVAGDAGFTTPCSIVTAAPAPPDGRARFAVELTGDNSALILHPVGSEVMLTRVADLANCGGVVSQVVPMPSAGSTYNYSGLAITGPTSAPTLVGTRLVRASSAGGGAFAFDAGIDLPPAGSGGPRAAIDVGGPVPLVSGTAGATGFRLMGDVNTILRDGFEG
jgi:hypothetical protein